MSSMFKKKGGPAFKPKIPSARSRPVARPTQPVTLVESETAISEPTPAATQQESREHTVHEEESEQSIQPPQSAPAPREPDKASPVITPPEPEETTTRSPRLQKQEPARFRQERNETEPASASKPQPELAVAPAGQSNDSTPDSSSTAPVVDDSSTSTSIAKPGRTRRAAASTAPANGAEDEELTTRPKKRQRKAPSKDDIAAPKPRQRKRKTIEGGEEEPSRRRRARSLTPEDAETQTVDLQKLKMADLTKDLHIGKKFSRHDELRERERQKRIKAKIEKDGESGDPDGSDSVRLAKEQSSTPSASVPPVDEAPSQAPAGPQFRIVDGQIVVDQNSLAVDRHARAAAARAGEDMETIEENDFTRLITSNSFMNTSKLRGPNVWTDEETVLFYRGLAMFGTDFEIISKMIPGKQRRHVKLKFNREERHCPRRVNAALVGEKTVAMDLEEYRAATGAEFESVEAIEAEQQKIEDGYEAERQRIADEQAEMMRKKKEELFADEDMDMGGVVSKKKKKGKKRKVEHGLNGEPIIEE